ncbi:VOC family protein [Hyphomonas sp.]|uniref:VOC family protein n=1 Tax=Hyphomonas sp. TaxID=87 RepID=UPI003919AC14
MTDKRKPVAEIAAEMGMGLLSPHLTCRNCAGAIAFYKEAFGAEEMMRLPGPDGRLLHAAIRVNGSMVMLTDEYPEMGGHSPLALGGSPVTLHLMVDDVDAVAARAVAAGAEITMPVADQFWGDRYGVVKDPYGHMWSIATPIWPPKSPEEMEAGLKASMERMSGS